MKTIKWPGETGVNRAGQSKIPYYSNFGMQNIRLPLFTYWLFINTLCICAFRNPRAFPVFQKFNKKEVKTSGKKRQRKNSFHIYLLTYWTEWLTVFTSWVSVYLFVLYSECSLISDSTSKSIYAKFVKGTKKIKYTPLSKSIVGNNSKTVFTENGNVLAYRSSLNFSFSSSSSSSSNLLIFCHVCSVCTRR